MAERIRVMQFKADTGRQHIVGFASNPDESTNLAQEFTDPDGIQWIERPKNPATKTEGGEVHFATVIKTAKT